MSLRQEVFMTEFTMKRVISASLEKVFPYFITPTKLERWSAPDGMTLKVPFYEAKDGGKYRYEHSSTKGLYICEGHIEKIVPNERLSIVDDIIQSSDGLKLTNLSADISFRRSGLGTEVTIFQSGFPDQKMTEECQSGWSQCLAKLEKLAGETRLAGREL